ncbi:ATP-binding protein [Halosimplex halophilum]|uniref:ATP-binding protein n=1 Tax=Halosimplex halophilum TaxID=2559572 RepID=UPI00107FAF9E|nr:ATP-binding protein [Halosimplex halophilum]
MKQEPKVNEVNEFLETASDFESPLEVIRESLSNSYDAGATEVEIEIRDQPNGSNILIKDDGEGMDKDRLETFFDLGNSQKTDSIGYKGHGTKIFYKSDHIEVTTKKDGKALQAMMDRPWEKLNDRVLPEYEVTEVGADEFESGTRIHVVGFKSGQDFNPRSLTYNKIHHYLKWKTIAGSTAHYFEDDTREMDIEIQLGDEIDDSMERLQTNNRLEFPDERLNPGDGEFPAERMCKVYPPQELTISYDGGETTAQVVGMVGGKAARNELPTFGKHSAQFGVWLAKDYIKVERANQAISHDNEFLHFFFIVNCQDLELSANRGQIRNKSSKVYRALISRLDRFMSKVAGDPWFDDYLEQRRVAELKRKAKSQRSSVEDRMEALSEQTTFSPSNSSEVLLAIERLADEGENNIQVEDFEPETDINTIVRNGKGLQTASVLPTLTTHFEEGKQLEGVDKLICWELGDLDQLRELERNGYRGGTIIFDFDEEKVIYKNGMTEKIDIMILDPENKAQTLR